MENNSHPVMAAVSSVISLLFAFFGWITIKDVQAAVTMVAGIIAITSGGFAISIIT